MDPNEALRIIRNQRELLVAMLAQSTDTHSVDTVQLIDWAERTAETVQDLDEWLSKGRFLPDAWSTPFGSPMNRNRDRTATS